MKSNSPFLPLSIAIAKASNQLRLGISRQAVASAVRRGDLPHRRSSLTKKARIYVRVKDLVDYLKKLERK